MSIIFDKKNPEYASPYDLGRHHMEKERHQWELQMRQMQQMHEMDMAKKAAEHELSKTPQFPSNQDLIHRIMEMQKKYIDRLEIENARLAKELARYEAAEGGQTGAKEGEHVVPR